MGKNSGIIRLKIRVTIKGIIIGKIRGIIKGMKGE